MSLLSGLHFLLKGSHEQQEEWQSRKLIGKAHKRDASLLKQVNDVIERNTLGPIRIDAQDFSFDGSHLKVTGCGQPARGCLRPNPRPEASEQARPALRSGLFVCGETLPEGAGEARRRALIVVGCMGRNAFLYPDEITSLHPARNKTLLNQLIADMLKNGWQSRPLLVIERESDYLAWTGSHRIAAAKIAELDHVPCYVLSEGELTSKGFDAERGHVEDHERLVILRKVGDAMAIRIMWQEGQPI